MKKEIEKKCNKEYRGKDIKFLEISICIERIRLDKVTGTLIKS